MTTKATNLGREESDRRLMPPFAALRAFEAVGRLGGVRKAGRELEIDHAVISRHVKALEAWVGQTLVVKTSTGYQLTQIGRTYHEEVAQALALIMAATGALMNSNARLKLNLWCIPGFGFLWLSERLNGFIGANPDIDIDFRPSIESPDSWGGDVDGDIRYLRDWQEPSVLKGLHRLEFARPNVIPVASPAFIASMNPLRSAKDLLDYTLIHEEDDLEWVHWLRAQGLDVRERLNGPRLWHAHLTLNAARQGHGIALANDMLLGTDIQDGRLAPLALDGAAFDVVRFGTYTLFGRSQRWNAPALRRFRQWLVNAVAAFEQHSTKP